jgi:5-hydroxyisourate hydrolase
MAGITTHVLDTAKGKPASGIAITLEVQRDGKWQTLGRGVTDADGRLRTLTEGIRLEVATYRLTFAIGPYGSPFYPEATVVFRVEDTSQHYHVPLLLSPYGYATYRGS